MSASPAPRVPIRRSKRRKTDVLTEFRRRGLLDAARRVFGAAGYEHATVEAIARAAEVAKGTLYLYYASKQAIYDAAFRDCMQELERLTRERVEAAPTLPDAIAAFVATRSEFFQSRPDFFRMYMDEIARLVAGPRRGRSPCRAMLSRQTELLERALAAGQARGEIRAVDTTAAAMAIFDMTRGLVSRHLLSHQRPDAQRDARLLTELIWAGLAPAPARS
jgi:AcrR family transcriptional regulator